MAQRAGPDSRGSPVATDDVTLGVVVCCADRRYHLAATHPQGARTIGSESPVDEVPAFRLAAVVGGCPNSAVTNQ